MVKTAIAACAAKVAVLVGTCRWRSVSAMADASEVILIRSRSCSSGEEAMSSRRARASRRRVMKENGTMHVFGGVRYATGAQLAMEERMLANTAPRLTRAQAAQAAQALGADPALLP